MMPIHQLIALSELLNVFTQQLPPKGSFRPISPMLQEL